MKKQIKPIKAAKTGRQPFKKERTSLPQFKGHIGRTEKTVKAIKIMPRIMEIIHTPRGNFEIAMF